MTSSPTKNPNTLQLTTWTQLIKDNPHTQNDTYWDNVVDKLYTKVNHLLTKKRHRL